MIELELKYQITEIPALIGQLKLVSQKKQKDIYYDTDAFDLLKNGNFLRVRNNKKLEFKLDIKEGGHLFCKETTFDLESINKRISEILELLKELGIDIKANNSSELFGQLSVLTVVEKTRKEYSFQNNCTIAIDYVKDLGNFIEIEIIVDKDNIGLKEAEKLKNELICKLINAEILSKSAKPTNVGYVELLLLQFNKKAYEFGKFKM